MSRSCPHFFKILQQSEEDLNYHSTIFDHTSESSKHLLQVVKLIFFRENKKFTLVWKFLTKASQVTGNNGGGLFCGLVVLLIIGDISR